MFWKKTNFYYKTKPLRGHMSLGHAGNYYAFLQKNHLGFAFFPRSRLFSGKFTCREVGIKFKSFSTKYKLLRKEAAIYEEAFLKEVLYYCGIRKMPLPARLVKVRVLVLTKDVQFRRTPMFSIGGRLIGRRIKELLMPYGIRTHIPRSRNSMRYPVGAKGTRSRGHSK